MMFLACPSEDAGVRALHDEARSQEGYVANFLRLWSWRPEVFRAFLDARMRLLEGATLSEREVAILNSTTASRRGDAYCSLAWGTKLARLSTPEIAGALLRRDDVPALSVRETALIDWASKVVADPNAITAGDVDALRAAGFSEQEIFDATLLVSFRLAFCTVNDALGASPDPQVVEEAPGAVRRSVTYGRAAATAAP